MSLMPKGRVNLPPSPEAPPAKQSSAARSRSTATEKDMRSLAMFSRGNRRRCAILEPLSGWLGS
jgi:hypothetical protein